MIATLKTSLAGPVKTQRAHIVTGIRRWHGGKIVLLWAGFFVVVTLVNANSYDRALVTAAALLAVITWVWLTGREKKA